MKVNLARWDRGLRYGSGFWLTLWAAAGGPWWCWIGVYLIATASWGLCPLYVAFNIRTARVDQKRLSDLEDLTRSPRNDR